MNGNRAIDDAASSDGPAKAPGPALSLAMLFAFLAIVFICATARGAVMAPDADNWYATIAKSSLNPPGWVFPVVWNFLYFLMGVAAWLTWRAAGGINAAGSALSLFLAQLMLNFTWSLLFFGLHKPGLAFLEYLVLNAAIAATLWLFWRHSRLAALLLTPYLGWSLFATWLTFAVWHLNP